MDISGVIAHGLATVRFTAFRAFDWWRRSLFQGAGRGTGALPWQPGQALPVAADPGRGSRDLAVRLAAEDVFVRRVELPIAAWGRWREVADFSLGQWTPFPPGGAAWDIRLAGKAARPGVFTADLAAVSRHVVDDLQQSAGDLGYRLVSVAVAHPGGDFELLEAGRRAMRRRSRLRAGAAFLLAVLLAGAGFAWDRRLEAEVAGMQAEVARLRPEAAAAAEQRRQRALDLLPETLAGEAAGRGPARSPCRAHPPAARGCATYRTAPGRGGGGHQGICRGCRRRFCPSSAGDPAFEAAHFTAPVTQMAAESRGLFTIRFRYRGEGR